MSQVSGSRRGDYHQAIERLFNEGTVSGLSEAQLLERFAARRDEAAFEALVERHGPMVLGVCRRFLRDPNDVDDAFQAVFLVLVRRAGDIRRKELLGNWLYGVACRVSVRARALAARRPATITEGDGDQLAGDSPEPDEGGSWLHEEVERLPRRYRQPVVACYFEGRTHEEAATLLGCPLGTVKGRLSRARDLLRKRLERRGLAVPAVALAAQLASPDLRAAVPVPLAHATVRTGLALATTGASLMTTSAISTSVRVLTEGALHAMVVTQIKAVAIPMTLVAAGLFTAGATVAARQDADGEPKAEQAVVFQARPEPTEAVKPASSASGETDEPPSVHLTTFRQLAPAMSELQKLHNRFYSDLIGVTTDEDRQNALVVHRGRVEAMIRKLVEEKEVSDAGRDLKAAFATLLRKSVETLDLKKPGGMVVGSKEFQSLTQLAQMYELESRSLSTDLDALKTSEERQAAWALHRARLAAIRKGIVPENYNEPVRDFAKVFLTYLKKVETHPEPPPAVAKAESPKSEPEKPAAPTNPPKAEAAPAPNVAQGGGFDGGEGGATDEPSSEQYRIWIARGSAVLARVDESAINKSVLKALEKPITLRSDENPTLGQMLKQIKGSVKTEEGKKVPIYVDPVALEEADKTLDAPVVIDLEDVPLKFSLRLMLKQLGLAYCIRDGVIIISSLEGVQQELMEAQAEQMGLNPDKFPMGGGMGGMGGGFGGMGGMGGGQGMM